MPDHYGMHPDVEEITRRLKYYDNLRKNAPVLSQRLQAQQDYRMWKAKADEAYRQETGQPGMLGSLAEMGGNLMDMGRSIANPARAAGQVGSQVAEGIAGLKNWMGEAGARRDARRSEAVEAARPQAQARGAALEAYGQGGDPLQFAQGVLQAPEAGPDYGQAMQTIEGREEGAERFTRDARVGGMSHGDPLEQLQATVAQTEQTPGQMDEVLRALDPRGTFSLPGQLPATITSDLTREGLLETNKPLRTAADFAYPMADLIALKGGAGAAGRAMAGRGGAVGRMGEGLKKAGTFDYGSRRTAAGFGAAEDAALTAASGGNEAETFLGGLAGGGLGAALNQASQAGRAIRAPGAQGLAATGLAGAGIASLEDGDSPEIALASMLAAGPLLGGRKLRELDNLLDIVPAGHPERPRIIQERQEVMANLVKQLENKTPQELYAMVESGGSGMRDRSLVDDYMEWQKAGKGLEKAQGPGQPESELVAARDQERVARTEAEAAAPSERVEETDDPFNLDNLIANPDLAKRITPEEIRARGREDSPKEELRDPDEDFLEGPRSPTEKAFDPTKRMGEPEQGRREGWLDEQVETYQSDTPHNELAQNRARLHHTDTRPDPEAQRWANDDAYEAYRRIPPTDVEGYAASRTLMVPLSTRSVDAWAAGNPNGLGGIPSLQKEFDNLSTSNTKRLQEENPEWSPDRAADEARRDTATQLRNAFRALMGEPFGDASVGFGDVRGVRREGERFVLTGKPPNISPDHWDDARMIALPILNEMAEMAGGATNLPRLLGEGESRAAFAARQQRMTDDVLNIRMLSDERLRGGPRQMAGDDVFGVGGDPAMNTAGPMSRSETTQMVGGEFDDDVTRGLDDLFADIGSTETGAPKLDDLFGDMAEPDAAIKAADEAASLQATMGDRLPPGARVTEGEGGARVVDAEGDEVSYEALRDQSGGWREREREPGFDQSGGQAEYRKSLREQMVETRKALQGSKSAEAREQLVRLNGLSRIIADTGQRLGMDSKDMASFEIDMINQFLESSGMARKSTDAPRTPEGQRVEDAEGQKYWGGVNAASVQVASAAIGMMRALGGTGVDVPVDMRVFGGSQKLIDPVQLDNMIREARGGIQRSSDPERAGIAVSLFEDKARRYREALDEKPRGRNSIEWEIQKRNRRNTDTEEGLWDAAFAKMAGDPIFAPYRQKLVAQYGADPKFKEMDSDTFREVSTLLKGIGTRLGLRPQYRRNNAALGATALATAGAAASQEEGGPAMATGVVGLLSRGRVTRNRAKGMANNLIGKARSRLAKAELEGDEAGIEQAKLDLGEAEETLRIVNSGEVAKSTVPFGRSESKGTLQGAAMGGAALGSLISLGAATPLMPTMMAATLATVAGGPLLRAAMGRSEMLSKLMTSGGSLQGALRKAGASPQLIAEADHAARTLQGIQTLRRGDLIRGMRSFVRATGSKGESLVQSGLDPFRVLEPEQRTAAATIVGRNDHQLAVHIDMDGVTDVLKRVGVDPDDAPTVTEIAEYVLRPGRTGGVPENPGQVLGQVATMVKAGMPADQIPRALRALERVSVLSPDIDDIGLFKSMFPDSEVSDQTGAVMVREMRDAPELAAADPVKLAMEGGLNEGQAKALVEIRGVLARTQRELVDNDVMAEGDFIVRHDPSVGFYFEEGTSVRRTPAQLEKLKTSPEWSERVNRLVTLSRRINSDPAESSAMLDELDGIIGELAPRGELAESLAESFARMGPASLSDRHQGALWRQLLGDMVDDIQATGRMPDAVLAINREGPDAFLRTQGQRLARREAMGRARGILEDADVLTRDPGTDNVDVSFMPGMRIKRDWEEPLKEMFGEGQGPSAIAKVVNAISTTYKMSMVLGGVDPYVRNVTSHVPNLMMAGVPFREIANPKRWGSAYRTIAASNGAESPADMTRLAREARVDGVIGADVGREIVREIEKWASGTGEGALTLAPSRLGQAYQSGDDIPRLLAWMNFRKMHKESGSVPDAEVRRLATEDLEHFFPTMRRVSSGAETANTFGAFVSHPSEMLRLVGARVNRAREWGSSGIPAYQKQARRVYMGMLGYAAGVRAFSNVTMAMTDTEERERAYRSASKYMRNGVLFPLTKEGNVPSARPGGKQIYGDLSMWLPDGAIWKIMRSGIREMEGKSLREAFPTVPTAAARMGTAAVGNVVGANPMVEASYKAGAREGLMDKGEAMIGPLIPPAIGDLSELADTEIPLSVLIARRLGISTGEINVGSVRR